MSEQIKALLIYEILGRPPEHIKKAMEDYIEKLNKKDEITLISKKIHEPKLLEPEENQKDAKEVYTTFAEVEISVENINTLFAIVLNTMPANIEILEPSSIRLNNFDLSGVLSELTIKLHKYDEVAKAVTMERNNLAMRLNEIQKNQPKMNITTSINKEEKEKPKNK